MDERLTYSGLRITAVITLSEPKQFRNLSNMWQD